MNGRRSYADRTTDVESIEDNELHAYFSYVVITICWGTNAPKKNVNFHVGL
jgi:hypothetical protein